MACFYLLLFPGANIEGLGESRKEQEAPNAVGTNVFLLTALSQQWHYPLLRTLGKMISIFKFYGDRGQCQHLKSPPGSRPCCTLVTTKKATNTSLAVMQRIYLLHKGQLQKHDTVVFIWSQSQRSADYTHKLRCPHGKVLAALPGDCGQTDLRQLQRIRASC